MAAMPGGSTEIEFHASAGPSLGVEVEFELVDRETRELSSAATEILGELGRDHPEGQHPKAKHELLECTIEAITGVCTTVAQARADIEATVAELTPHLDRRGLALMCSGTHPFSDWTKQQISPNPRYHRLVEQMQWPARRLQIFGIHTHVGVRSAERSIAIATALTAYIPHLLAISAASPYWSGQDTGLASCRSKIFEALPTTGIPAPLADWAEFEQFMHTLIAAGAISSIREVWWDIRPHPDFGTVELRICDGVPTLTEVGAIAALSQTLVAHLDAQIDGGERPHVPPSWLVRQNKWRAARYGVDAEIIADDEGDTIAVRDAIDALVEELGPTAAGLGCERELLDVLEIVDRGASYQRQRRIIAGGGTLVDVVDGLVGELKSDLG